MSINGKFGELVKVYREEKGLSKKSLAKLTHLSEATINNIERGYVGANLDTIERLKLILCFSKNDFMEIFN